MVSNMAGLNSKLVNSPIIFELKHVEANLPKTRPVHVMSNDHAWIGPPKNKLKPTWTQVTWMDCGPKNKNNAATNAVTKPMLGKRNSQGEEAVAVLGKEGREREQSRSQNDAQNNETTKVLEHPGRTP